jgi:FkbM family methyltransferase
MLRYLATKTPPSVIARLNRAQFDYPRIGRALRAIAVRVAAGEGVIQRGPGAGLRIDATGTNSGYLLGTTEPDEQQCLAEHVRVGDVVYDIGANIGFHTLIAARLVGPAGRVYSFEPWPANADQLRRNVAANGFTNVEVIQAAASDREHTVMLHDPDGNRVRVRVVEAETCAAEAAVEATDVDSWRKRTGARLPSLIKLDVEGVELSVLRGALATIRAARPAILVEAHWTNPDLSSFYDAELAELGYTLTTIEGGALPENPMRVHALLVAG